MCGGGGGGGGGSAQPTTPAASVQAATPLSRNTVTAAQSGSTSAAKAREARSVGKRPMRVGLDVSTVLQV
jgi:hypothetical protein